MPDDPSSPPSRQRSTSGDASAQARDRSRPDGRTAAPIALVTGAARRVGRSISLELARAGADLILHYNRSVEEAAEVALEIEALGRRAWSVGADLTDPAAVDRLWEVVASEPGRLDILVNSAAIYDRAPLEQLEPHRWDALMALNLRGPYLMCRGALPLMRRGGGGVIINVADVAGYRPWANHLHYSVSKAGLIALTHCLALELAPEIRVNAVAPGTVLPAAFQTEDDIEAIRERTPLGRLGTPEDVGRAIVFLALGPDSITGQVLSVDGGRSLFSRE